MNECEIFLSKLAGKAELYSEAASKLGISETTDPTAEDIIKKLSSVSLPVKFRLYVSVEEIPNSDVAELIEIFRNVDERNENISIEVIEDEFLNLIDSSDRITAECKPRSLVHRDGDLHPTVHVWVIKRKDMGIYVLLQKRSPIKDIHPDCYDVSSAGHVSQGGEFRDAAVRELREELGIDAAPENLEFIGTKKNYFSEGEVRDNELSAVYLYRGEVRIEDLTLQAAEVSEVCWAEIDELLSVMNKDKFRHCILPEELQMIKKAVF